MVHQLGPPALFLSCSAADAQWEFFGRIFQKAGSRIDDEDDKVRSANQ